MSSALQQSRKFSTKVPIVIALKTKYSLFCQSLAQILNYKNVWFCKLGRLYDLMDTGPDRLQRGTMH